MRRVVVRRCGRPAWVTSPDRIGLESVLGDGADWAYAIPWMYRAIASPRTGERFPRPPAPGRPFEEATAYWAALLHLMLYSFGWSRPALGAMTLRRMVQDSTVVESDDHLDLVLDTWATDGQFDYFIAWLGGLFQLPAADELRRLGRFDDDSDQSLLPDADRAWVESKTIEAEELVRSVVPGQLALPVVGGLDPLHLSYHCSAPLEPIAGTGGAVAHGDVGPRVLVVDSLSGWYRLLIEHRSSIASTGGTASAVDVVVRPIGVVGRFTCSSATGLWHSCSAEIHLMGN